MLLYSALLTSVGWSTAAWWWTSSWTISILPRWQAAYSGDWTPCRERTVECHMTSKNDEAIHMLALDVLLHCMHLYITQCCTLLMSPPWERSSSTSWRWLNWAAKYIAVNPSCIRDISRVRQIQQTPPTACTTVKPLYKDTTEIRTPLYSGHCLGSKLDRVVYKTIPKMRAPH